MARELTQPSSATAPTVSWGILATVSLGYLLVSWAMAPISAILPTISADLGVDVTAAGWVMNSYFLLLVGTLLIAGRVGDVFGHRPVFACGIFVFGLACLASGLTNALEPLIVTRAIQGIGAAMVFGTSLALVAEAVPSARRGMAIGILTMTAGAASLLGVAFSAYAVQNLSWHWAFFVPIPVALVAFVFALRLPAGARSGSVANLDWRGGILLFAALTVGMLSLGHFHEGEESFQQGAHYHLPMHLMAVALLGAFAWVETRVPQPLLQIRMLREVPFASGIFANGIAHMSMLGSSFLLPFLLERGRGLAPADTAWLMTSMQVAMLSSSLLAGALYDRKRTPVLGWATLGGISGGMLLLGLLGASLSFGVLIGIAALLGAGLGGFTTVNNTALMSSANSGNRGFASGMVETTRQLGHSVGVSMTSSIMAGALAGVPAAELASAYADGFQRSTLAMGILCALALLAIVVPHLSDRRSAQSQPSAPAIGRTAAT